VLLSDADLRVNAVAYLAQHLIVLLDPPTLSSTLHHAYGRPEFRDRHYASFHTGAVRDGGIRGRSSPQSTARRRALAFRPANCTMSISPTH